MKPIRNPRRRYAALLFVALAVLVFGIVQWSFLPILIQNGPVGGAAVLEMAAGHSAKFAAPFKCLFGDGLGPCLVQSRIIVRRIASRVIHPPEAPISGKDVFFLSYYPLRAPPSA
jgi:hypothetical protein